MGRLDAAARTPYRGYARDIGLAFQIADDLLDHDGDEAAAGKRLHKDAEAGKATFVSLMGEERARQQCAMLVAQAIEHLARPRRRGRPAPRDRPLRRGKGPLMAARATHRRLSGHLRPAHAGPSRHHPARRAPRRPAGHRGHHQPVEVADVHRSPSAWRWSSAKSPILPSVSVVEFDSLLMDFAEREGASLILRGLRAVADFEYEYQMAGMNQQLNDRIETVFLMADVSLQPIASRLVKEIARYGGAIDKFVTARGRRRRGGAAQARQNTAAWRAGEHDEQGVVGISLDGAGTGRGQARAGRAGRADRVDGRARRGRGRSRQPLDARTVERRQGGRPAAPRHRPAPRLSHPATDRAGLLQRPELPPRHPRLHGAGRRSRRAPGRAARRCPTSPPNSATCRTCAGSLSMARADTLDSANSQFFIMLAPTFKLDHKYTAFGRVIEGMAAVDGIAAGRAARRADDDRPRDASAGRCRRAAAPRAAALRRQRRCRSRRRPQP